MKRKSIKKIVQLIVLSFIITIIASCNNNIVNDDFEKGKTTVNIFVPNYMKMANKGLNARVVAPQTKSVQFSYIYENEEIVLDKVLLSEANANAIEDAETGLFGNTYKITFSGIYVGTYAANSMTVSLLDENDDVISKGSNAEEIKVTKEESVNASFYTVPVSADAKSSNIGFGEMKFFKQSFVKEKNYQLKIYIDSTEKNYPDIVIFNINGTYSKYYSVDSVEEATIDFGKFTESKDVYIGIFADDGETSYKLYFVEAEEVEGTEDFESINKVGFGKDGEIDSSFATSGFPKPVMKSNVEDVDKDGYAVFFNFKFLEDGESSLKRNIVLNKKSLLSFSVKTDIYEE